MKNRRIFVSVIAIILVVMMIASLVLTVIPVMADGSAETAQPECAEDYATVQQTENNYYAI